MQKKLLMAFIICQPCSLLYSTSLKTDINKINNRENFQIEKEPQTSKTAEEILKKPNIKILFEKLKSIKFDKAQEVQENIIKIYRKLCFLIAAESFNSCCQEKDQTAHVDVDQIKNLYKKTIESVIEDVPLECREFLIARVHENNFYNPFYQFIAATTIVRRNNQSSSH